MILGSFTNLEKMDKYYFLTHVLLAIGFCMVTPAFPWGFGGFGSQQTDFIQSLCRKYDILSSASQPRLQLKPLFCLFNNLVTSNFSTGWVKLTPKFLYSPTKRGLKTAKLQSIGLLSILNMTGAVSSSLAPITAPPTPSTTTTMVTTITPMTTTEAITAPPITMDTSMSASSTITMMTPTTAISSTETAPTIPTSISPTTPSPVTTMSTTITPVSTDTPLTISPSSPSTPMPTTTTDLPETSTR